MRPRSACSTALVLALIFGSSVFAADETVSYRYFRVPQRLLTPGAVARSGFIRDHGGDAEYALGYLPTTRPIPGEWSQHLVELDALDVARHGIDVATLKLLPEPAARLQPWEDYHTYTTLTTELKDLAVRFPQLVKLESVGKSVQGRDLWMLRLTSSRNTQKPKLLYISSMHGDEVTGKEMLVYLVRDLLGGYGRDSRITTLLDSAEIFVMPSMNPDGTEKRQRWNARGTDLNRDFPDYNDAPFGGNRAIETLALMEFHKKHHFAISMNFHGGTVVVNIPWDAKPNPLSSPKDLFWDHALVLKAAQDYARLNATMYGMNTGSFVNGVTYGWEWYEVKGGMQDWTNVHLQGTHVTTELSHVKWPPASQLPSFWGENRESLLSYLEHGIDGIHLKVTDEAGAPLAVSVGVSSSTRAIRFPDGLVNRATVADSQDVTVSAAGYVTQTLRLTPWRYQGDAKPVTLVKKAL